MNSHRSRAGRVAGRRSVLAGGAALAFAGCADSDIGRRPPPLPPSPVAAAGTSPAAVRAAQAPDLVGTWQMLLLPAAVAEQVNVTPRFDQTYQWLLITDDGRIGFIATPEY